MDTIFDEIMLDNNKLLSKNVKKRFTILGARTNRYLAKVRNLQEAVAQMQATYEAQLSIQQNSLMKVFTVVTSIFMPLTLLTGWYGMNFEHMPELESRLGYPGVIGLSIIIAVSLLAFFRHKKWI